MKSIEKVVKEGALKSPLWAMWNWVGALSLQTIEEQFAQLVSSGFTGIVVRPSSSLSPDHLSEEFFIFLHRVCQLAADSGVEISIGDNFFRLPESPLLSATRRYSSFRSARLVVDKETDLHEGDQFIYTPDPVRKAYVVAVERHGKKISLNNVETIYGGEDDTPVTWDVPKGHWRVLELAVTYEKSCDGAFIPNFFSMRAGVQYQMEMLELYKSELLPKYEGVFTGVYCEIPPVLPSKAGIPWDEEVLVSKYRSRFKRNLIETIPALFYPVADCEAKYRPHIYSFLHDTIFERFPAVIQKWCDGNGLKFWLAGAESDRADQDSTLPSLFTTSDQKFPLVGNSCSGSSIVNEVAEVSLFSRRLLEQGETFAIVGRSTDMSSPTLGEIKRALDRAVFSGADTIFVDGIYTGSAYRYDSIVPMGFSFSHPDFSKLKDVVAYGKELLALQKHRVINKASVAVVYPSHSLMADYLPEESDLMKDAIDGFIGVVKELRSRGIPFTVVDEQCLLSCSLSDEGELITSSGHQFFSIVLPYMRLVNNSFFVLLEKFARKKSSLFFLNTAPEGSFDDGHGQSFLQRVHKLLKSKVKKVSYGPLWAMVDALEYEGDSYALDYAKAEVDTVAVPFLIDGESVLAVYNSGYEDATVTVSAPSQDSFLCGNLWTGREEQAEDIHGSGISFKVYPGENVFLKGIDSVGDDAEGPVRSYRLRLKEEKWRFSPLSMNCFPLSRWNSKLGVNRAHGTLQYYYETTFTLDGAFEKLYLTLFSDPGFLSSKFADHFRITLNGSELKPMRGEALKNYNEEAFLGRDGSVPVYDLSGVALKGLNRLLLFSANDRELPDPVAYPLFVSVDAPVEQTVKGWTVPLEFDPKRAKWGGDGYPYFVGDGEYQMAFEVPAKYDKLYINFYDLSGTASVHINGTKLPGLLWSPFRIDITDLVSPGRNEMRVVVRGTLDPISRLKGDRTGIMGPVSLEVTGGCGGPSMVEGPTAPEDE